MKELMFIQSQLKAPKNQMNKFGGYKYRSCEDILEAVKPVLKANNCTLTICDEIVLVGDRFYIKATATIRNESGETEQSTAYAREPENKKGMDEPQVTGTASSYARKYALNGLFCIDDTKDADTNEYKTEQDARQKAEPQQAPSVSLNTQQSFELASALDQVRQSQSVDELQSLWKELTAWQGNPTFKAAVKKRKDELTPAA